MNLKQQVVNLKYAKKLKKLGVKQKSLFYWTKAFYADGFNLSWGLEYKEMNKLRFFEYGDKKIKDVENCSAFTASELGEMLPLRNKYWSDKLPEEKWSNEYWCEINLIWSGQDKKGRPKNAYSINYIGDLDKRGFQIFLLDESISDENLANAMAKMLVYLIENNLYDPKTKKTQTTV